MDNDFTKLVIRCNEMALGLPIEDKHLRSLPHAEEPYYAFLYYLARELKPQVIVELGVFKGVGLAHLAAGCSTAWCVGVDNCKHDWDKALAPYPQNTKVYQMDSVEFLELYPGPLIDIVHLDTTHDDRVFKEFALSGIHMNHPGVICIDDIHYDETMGNIWRSLKGRKIELNSLHVTGYGVILA